MGICEVSAPRPGRTTGISPTRSNIRQSKWTTFDGISRNFCLVLTVVRSSDTNRTPPLKRSPKTSIIYSTAKEIRSMRELKQKEQSNQMGGRIDGPRRPLSNKKSKGE